MESTDGERLSKCKECKNPTLCINPYHIVIHVKELEVYLVNFINNTRKSNLVKVIRMCNVELLNRTIAGEHHSKCVFYQ